jgi:hypothetical protein
MTKPTKATETSSFLIDIPFHVEGRALGVVPRAAQLIIIAAAEIWCGLDWQPACLKFHEGLRPVRTASVSQVRQPIYRRSVGRWRNYERTLAFLFDTLHPGSQGPAGASWRAFFHFKDD